MTNKSVSMDKYKWYYKTPDNFTDIVMSSDGEYLTGLWFLDSKDEDKHCTKLEEKYLDIFKITKKWLDIYFSGCEPNFTPIYKIYNQTEFRKMVTNCMNEIPYGKTTTYKSIASIVGKKLSKEKMSAQAVGGAVGANQICIIVPCHRVIGTNGCLVGYGGGIKNKIGLLNIEGGNYE